MADEVDDTGRWDRYLKDLVTLVSRERGEDWSGDVKGCVAGEGIASSLRSVNTGMIGGETAPAPWRRLSVSVEKPKIG